MNLRNLALAVFVSLTIVFALALVGAYGTPSTRAITSTSTVYDVTTSTIVITLNGSVTTQFALCDATTYSAAGIATSGQTSNPTTTLGSTTYIKTMNVTETSGYVTTSEQVLGPPTASPWEIVTCTYVS